MQLAEAHRNNWDGTGTFWQPTWAIRRRPSRRSRRSVGRYRLGQTTWNSSIRAVGARSGAKHGQVVRNWFDYRVRTTRKQSSRPFEPEGYFDRKIEEYQAKMKATEYHVVLTNNRTPLELEIPFAPDLSVENLLDVGKILLRLGLDSTPFPDLGTSARLSLSITIDGMAQSFNKTLSEIEFTRRRTSTVGESHLAGGISRQDRRGDEEQRLSKLLRRGSIAPFAGFHLHTIHSICAPISSAAAREDLQHLCVRICGTLNIIEVLAGG